MAACIRQHWSGTFDLALIAGSGIHEALVNAECVGVLPYSTIPGLPESKVIGHTSSLQWLRIAGKNVLLFGGRFHRYEGHQLSQSVLPSRISAALGITALLCTNAAGGMNSGYHAADIMLADDILNMTQVHVSQGPTDGSTKSLLDGQWALAAGAQLQSEPWLRRGVYCSVSGPSYETRAEIAMFSRFADAIGMSTIHEAQAATLMGMRVLAFSVITNVLCSTEQNIVQHDEVISTARLAAARIAQVIDVCCSTLSEVNAR